MDAMCVENVLNGTEGIYRNHLFRENVLGGTKSWFTTSNLSGLPLPHNPQLVFPGQGENPVFRITKKYVPLNR